MAKRKPLSYVLLVFDVECEAFVVSGLLNLVFERA
jgi:hypothetical protein